MAYGVTASNGKIGYNVKHYIVDEFDDMKKLPTSAAAGSTAFVVLTSQSFMLNNKREWVEFTPAGSQIPQPADTSIIWDGGLPEGHDDGCDCGSKVSPGSSQSLGMSYIWDGGEVQG